MVKNISVAQYIPLTNSSNGPGRRAVLWLQGCDKQCSNCCNPQFQPFQDNNTDLLCVSDQIQRDYFKYSLRGLTLTGGEPLYQAFAVQQLVADLRQKIEIDIMAFSGYTAQEISQMEWVPQYIDLIIAGPYIDSLEHNKGLIASTNQEIVRLNSKFDDVSDDELKYSNRIIETHIQDDKVIITGLTSINDIGILSSYKLVKSQEKLTN